MIRVGDLREAQAAVLAFKAADRDLRKRVNDATREQLNPAWRSLVAQHATTPLAKAVLVKGARIAAGNPPVAVAASSKRPLRGGLVPAESWPAVEFGANRNQPTTYTRRTKSGSSTRVTRRTRRQLPPRTRSGWTVYAAFRQVAPRAASLWTQLIMRVYHDAAEGKRT